MKAEEKEKNEIDRAKGREYKQVWKNYIEPFFLAKEQDLFDAFRTTPTSNKEFLIDVKLQHNALIGLRAEFMSYIDTGNLARQALLEEDSKTKANKV